MKSSLSDEKHTIPEAEKQQILDKINEIEEWSSNSSYPKEKYQERQKELQDLFQQFAQTKGPSGSQEEAGLGAESGPTIEEID